jgi:dihydrofolate synthase/folylpolyglutamate synthase
MELGRGPSDSRPRRVLVFAGTRKKDVEGMLRLLLPRFDELVLTRYQDNPRGVPLEKLTALVRRLGARRYHALATPPEAWARARALAADDDLVCITGSFFLAAELRRVILAEAARTAPPADRRVRAVPVAEACTP